MNMSIRAKHAPLYFLSILAGSAALDCGAIGSAPAEAGTLTVLHSFCQESFCTDGAVPSTAPLLADGANFFGTTVSGGAHNGGVVYELVKVNARYKYKVIHNFCQLAGCADGSQPGPLVEDTAGNLYGAAAAGGAGSAGTVFELIPDQTHTRWKLRLLYSFCRTTGCPDGIGPNSLTYRPASAGALYDGVSPLFGTAQFGGNSTGFGGNGSGTAFELTPRSASSQEPPGQAREKNVYTFCSKGSCTDGATPSGPLLLNLRLGTSIVGATVAGGFGLDGDVYELTSNQRGTKWTEKVLYSFCGQALCADGENPQGGVAVDNSGTVFGTTFTGGNANKGVLFQVVPNGVNSQETVLYSFCPQANCTDGSYPQSGVFIDAASHTLSARPREAATRTVARCSPTPLPPPSTCASGRSVVCPSTAHFLRRRRF
jgi:hypothetical protein